MIRRPHFFLAGAWLLFAVLLLPTVSQARPCPCPMTARWVMGEDGKPYLNACIAACAGKKVSRTLTDNELKKLLKQNSLKPCLHVRALPCPKGSRRTWRLHKGCQLPGPCRTTTAKQPSCVCPLIYSPVCGSDRKTYSNSCLAGCAQIKLFTRGRCRMRACPKISPPYCGKKMKLVWRMVRGCSTPFCARPRPPARRAKHSCVCPAIYAPVCGIDGVTYSNRCLANCKKVTLVHIGNCRKKACPKIKVKACPPGKKRLWKNILGCAIPGLCVSLCSTHRCAPGQQCKLKKDVPTCVCRPLKCPTICVYGAKTQHGCPTCECKSSSRSGRLLPKIRTLNSCKHRICPLGRTCKMRKGKATCVCPPVCLLYCKHGLVEKHGCLICKCRSVGGRF